MTCIHYLYPSRLSGLNRLTTRYEDHPQKGGEGGQPLPRTPSLTT